MPKKAAFVTPDGLVQYTRGTSGLTKAPATFQRLGDKMHGHMRWTMAIVFLDDVIVYASIFEEHQRRLKVIL